MNFLNFFKSEKFQNRKKLIIILGIILCVVISGGISFASYLNRKPSVALVNDFDPPEDEEEEYIPPPKRISEDYKEGFYTFLLVGSDLDAYHADTLMVASYDSNAGIINLISIPRDTRVDVKRTPQKINAAFGLGGIEKLSHEVQSLLGFMPQYYLNVELEGFVELVDIIGGVEFDVPVDMKRDDNYQDLHIDLKAGLQVLDGEKAIQLVRYRGYPEADLKRVRVQQDFIIAALKQCVSLSNLTKASDIIKVAQKYLDTNMPLRDMQWFARNLVGLDTANIFTYTLPIGKEGQKNGHFYIYLDKSATLELVNSTVNPYLTDILPSDVQIVESDAGTSTLRNPDPETKDEPGDTPEDVTSESPPDTDSSPSEEGQGEAPGEDKQIGEPDAYLTNTDEATTPDDLAVPVE